MNKAFYKLKRKVYYTATILFPGFYKRRSFLKLCKAFGTVDKFALLPEKELLILYYLLNDNIVAVDIGANNGVYSYFFKEIKKANRVIAFEPLPHLYRKLKKWFGNIELYDCALSNKKTTTTIHIPIIKGKLYESRAKLDNIKEENEKGFENITIQTDTLDNVLAKLKLGSLDIIKIDIEGHELKAIEGGKKTISTFQPYLLVEIEARHHGGSIEDAISQISSLNYHAYFFNISNKRLEAYSEFNESKMQKMKDQNTFEYINNFIFFPDHKKNEVSRINEKLATYFNTSSG
jgi:FkbM family methyltransferase